MFEADSEEYPPENDSKQSFRTLQQFRSRDTNLPREMMLVGVTSSCLKTLQN